MAFVRQAGHRGKLYESWVKIGGFIVDYHISAKSCGQSGTNEKETVGRRSTHTLSYIQLVLSDFFPSENKIKLGI